MGISCDNSKAVVLVSRHLASNAADAGSAVRSANNTVPLQIYAERTVTD